jgi:hypothetical protein
MHTVNGGKVQSRTLFSLGHIRQRGHVGPFAKFNV